MEPEEFWELIGEDDDYLNYKFDIKGKFKN
jgi:hypothetical protein